MPKSLQSSKSFENTGRSVGAPALFATFPKEIQEELRYHSVRRIFSDGQIIWHRGDEADGFWVIDKGQVKLGHYAPDGLMQALFILGEGDSFGELACLGHFPRVLDAEAIGTLEMTWVSDVVLTRVVANSPAMGREMLRALSVQLQEALDNLIVFRNMPAPKRLAQRLLALAAGREAPVRLNIRQQELAELVGVSRMTIATALGELEKAGLVSRQYGRLVVNDPQALRNWMRS